MAKGQAERLMPLIAETLAEAGRTPEDLAAIGVGIGPGNFTGLRISVSAARGLALALGIPAIGVTGFEAMALGLPRPCTALIKAPRDMVYAQTLHHRGETQPVLCHIEALSAPPEGGVFVAHGAEKADMHLPGPVQAPIHNRAEAIARIAAARDRTPGLHRPAPLYIRPADAAPSRETGPVILSS